ncbi:MAG TPA: hypothetical protein VJL88_03210 [Nitrospira sp.]|nr:hypothetical protein [Nitrospira sp.]
MLVLMLMFAVLASVLMVMPYGIGTVLVSMGMLVLMFMVVSLSRSMLVFMAVNVLVGMGAFHLWYSL